MKVINFEYSPQFRKLVKEGESDLKAGEIITWQEFLKHEKSHDAFHTSRNPKAQAGSCLTFA